MCYINLDSYFLLFILYIFLFNRYVIINHTDTYLDLFFKKKNILHVLVFKKIRPNFAKFNNFGGGWNFCNNEIKNLDDNNLTQHRNSTGKSKPIQHRTSSVMWGEATHCVLTLFDSTQRSEGESRHTADRRTPPRRAEGYSPVAARRGGEQGR